jgi:acyl phosphate:glycerol-3-phosphate acyltransferase
MSLDLIIALVGAYLLGGIPFGFLAVRLLLQQDLRQLGSGNIGATNVSRCFRKKRRIWIFLLIWFLDMGKGFLPTWWGMQGDLGTLGLYETASLMGLAAVVGHVFCPYLRFKGGKGVSTVCGLLLALDWQVFLIAMGAFFLVLGLTRVVALGSMALGLALAASVVLLDPRAAFQERLSLTLLCFFLAIFLVWTHRENIKGLVRFRRERQQQEKNP